MNSTESILKSVLVTRLVVGRQNYKLFFFGIEISNLLKISTEMGHDKAFSAISNSEWLYNWANGIRENVEQWLS